MKLSRPQHAEAARGLVKARRLGYSAAMSETPPDFNALAKRYLDLWQDQLGRMAKDPALAETMARGVAMMTQTAAAMAQATGLKAEAKDKDKASARPGKNEGSDPSPSSPSPSAPGPQAAAAASDDSSVDLGQLTRRLAALEERVAQLESRPGRGGGAPAPKPGRRRTRGMVKA